MSVEIQVRRDSQRGCGWRKPGGLYLVDSSGGIACCKLPIALNVCPTCGAGIKFARSWTWIDAQKLFPDARCTNQATFCPLANNALGRIGLLWVGEQFYKSPRDFSREAEALGISRRIAAVPREFVCGETWVALAHVHCVPELGPDGVPGWKPGIFRIFRPEAIEYVVTGEESEEELASLVKRRITPVRIERIGETMPLPDCSEGLAE
jgi:hypothetical protein